MTGVAPLSASVCRRRSTRGLALPRLELFGERIPWEVITLRASGHRRYVMSGPIHSGAFSDIHVGLRRGDRTSWAVKRVSVAHASGPLQVNQIDYLQRERDALRAMGDLEDEVWLDNGDVYLVTSLAATDCEQLNRRLNHRISMATRRELNRHFLEGAAGELARLHQAGFVHRDIKPANILVAYDGSIRVRDLGFALPCGPEELKLDRVVGTPCYTAPETQEQRLSSHASDVFSLCVCWAEHCLGGGHSPFYTYLAEGKGFAFDDFFASRARLVSHDARGDAGVDWERVPDHGGDRWDAFYRALKRLDPKLGEKVLLYGLAPDPAHRWPAARLRDYTRTLRQVRVSLTKPFTMGRVLKGANKLLAQADMREAVGGEIALESDPLRKAIVGGLLQYIDQSRRARARRVRHTSFRPNGL